MTDINYRSQWDRLAQTSTILSSARKRAKKKAAVNPSPCNPPKTTTNSFFDRLSKAETFATARSKGKSVSPLKKMKEVLPKIDSERKPFSPSVEKTLNTFFDRMSTTETYATSTMKGKKSPAHEGNISPNHGTLAMNRQTTNAFFDRMSKAETYATADMKGKITPPHETPALNKQTTNAFFDRMSKAATYATADMKGKITPPHETQALNRKNADMKRKVSPPHETPALNRQTTNAFFDRMSKAETYATSSMKGKITSTHENPACTELTTNAFFERMNKAETYATSSMKGKICSEHDCERQSLPKDTRISVHQEI